MWHLNRPVQATCLNDESFQESGIVLIISRANLPQLLLSCILHLANQVILCLQQLQAGSIQLCRVLTVAGNEKPCFIRYKIVTSGPDWIHHCWAFYEHRNIKSTERENWGKANEIHTFYGEPPLASLCAQTPVGFSSSQLLLSEASQCWTPVTSNTAVVIPQSPKQIHVLKWWYEIDSHQLN